MEIYINKSDQGDGRMILNTEKFSISMVTEEDINGILEVYNSNQKFLLSHMDRTEVSIEWVKQEQEEMKGMNFKTLIIKENKSDSIMGFIDLLFKEECYLSLLMIHNSYRNKGYGKEVYEELENYLIKLNFTKIRIDVVYSYDEAVLKFWKSREFREIEKIQLQWGDRLLDAVVMKKDL